MTSDRVSAISPASTAAAGLTREADEQGWLAQLRLQFAVRDGRTFLAQRSHVGPLLVQRPFYPEAGTCHAYIVHPPGGVVGGDRLELQVVADAGSHVVLTTPAATKFYRSAGKVAYQAQQIDAGEAIVEWLPQETIFYRGAIVRSETRVQLAPGGKFIGWEIPCFGMPSRHEPFDAGELRLNLELWLDAAPLLIDRMRISGGGESRTAPWGLGGHQAVGTLLAYPADREAIALARSVTTANAEVAVTLVDGVLVCRCVAAQAETVKHLFIAIWQLLRPHLLSLPAVLPRIWRT
ncbi:MAG TPA: urease accessory protein UreD [Steroidobacteraceae bacterium]